MIARYLLAAAAILAAGIAIGVAVVRLCMELEWRRAHVRRLQGRPA